MSLETKGDGRPVHGPLPDFVEAVLAQWDGLASFARDGFETHGRGVVAIEAREGVTNLIFAPRPYFADRGDATVLAMLDAYDPDNDIVLHFDADAGLMRTIRVRTAPGGRNPKGVWFFEMLRRLTEEPESVPDNLPEWFWRACERLDAARKDNPSPGP